MAAKRKSSSNRPARAARPRTSRRNPAQPKLDRSRPEAKIGTVAAGKPSKDRMAAAPRDPSTRRPVDPNTGQPVSNPPRGKVARQPKSETVKPNHLRMVFQIINVEEAQNEAGVIVRKSVEATGHRGASLVFEANDPEHHDMLQNGKFVSVELKEVAGHNA